MGQALPPSRFAGGEHIFIVDDDAPVCDALMLLLKIDGFLPHIFSDGSSFLEAIRLATPACVILDIHLPGRSGLDVLRQLSRDGFGAPVFMISGQSDISTVVEAMKIGAVDFLEKPFAAGVIIDRIRSAVKMYRGSTAREFGEFPQFPECHLLTRRERDVLSQIASGSSNKEAGRKLGISPRTIEVHRARVMDKLGARNAADLMRIVLSHAQGKRHERAAD